MSSIFTPLGMRCVIEKSWGMPPVVLADGLVFEQGEKKRMLSKEGIEELEGAMLTIPGSTECPFPLEHFFAPGIYVRQITMPKGARLIGATHTTEHLNVILAGRATVIIDGRVYEINPGMTFVSGAGVRKVLNIHETCVWQTIHPNPTNERDIAKLEASLCVMSETHKAHFEGLKPI